MSAIFVDYKEVFYETMTMIPSVLKNNVHCRKVNAIKNVRYRKIPLYFLYSMLSIDFLKESRVCCQF